MPGVDLRLGTGFSGILTREREARVTLSDGTRLAARLAIAAGRARLAAPHRPSASGPTPSATARRHSPSPYSPLRRAPTPRADHHPGAGGGGSCGGGAAAEDAVERGLDVGGGDTPGQRAPGGGRRPPGGGQAGSTAATAPPRRYGGPSGPAGWGARPGNARHQRGRRAPPRGGPRAAPCRQSAHRGSTPLAQRCPQASSRPSTRPRKNPGAASVLAAFRARPRPRHSNPRPGDRPLQPAICRSGEAPVQCPPLGGPETSFNDFKPSPPRA